MDRQQFEHLRDLHGKRIDSDIRFVQGQGSSAVFENVEILNEDGWAAQLHGTYSSKRNSIIYVVVLDGIGPICRICVRGSLHGSHGRTHKHALSAESCPRQNLQIDVTSRPELDALNAQEVFRRFCVDAKILFKGTFYDPEGT